MNTFKDFTKRYICITDEYKCFREKEEILTGRQLRNKRRKANRKKN